jgi:hypothetical protein
VFIAIIIFGLECIVSLLKKLKSYLKKLCTACIIAILVFIQIFWLVNTYHEVRYWQARMNVYREASVWINDNLPYNSTVAAFELGYIGFYGKRTVVDYAGIIYPYKGEQPTYLKLKKPTHIFLVGNDRYIEDHPLWNLSGNAKVVWDKKLPSEWAHRGVNHVYIIEYNWQ